MSRIVVVTPPGNVELVPLGTAKTEMGVTGSTDDAFLTKMLSDASSEIERFLGRPIVRGQYKELRAGSGRRQMAIRLRPLVSLDAVTYDDAAETLSDYEISDNEAGLIARKVGLFGVEPSDGVSDPTVWEITATSGWFVPDDDVTGTIDVVASDNSYNSSALFPVHLKAGDTFIASGFTSASNNGIKTVATSTTSKITVDQALVDEGSASRTLTFSNLPGGITRAVMAFVKGHYYSRDRDSAILEESVSGAVSVKYATSSDGATAVMGDFHAALRPFVDV